MVSLCVFMASIALELSSIVDLIFVPCSTTSRQGPQSCSLKSGIKSQSETSNDLTTRPKRLLIRD